MKTIPENLPEIVVRVKPKRRSHDLYVLRISYANRPTSYFWQHCADNEGDTKQDTTPEDAYAACVVALLGRFIDAGVALQIDRTGVWCMGKSYDGDLLSALYAAFVARPDLFGEAQ